MGQKLVCFGQLGPTRSRQDESKEVHEVGSKRPSSGGNGGHVLSLYPLIWRSLASLPNPVKQQITAECLQTKRRRQEAGEHKTKRKPTALRHLPRSKRAKAQHVQMERGAAYVVKQLVSQKSQVTRVNRLQPLNCATNQKSTYRQTRCIRRERENAARSRRRDPPAIRHEQNEGLLSNARHLPAERGERGARRRDRASTWHCLGALGVLSETREEI